VKKRNLSIVPMKRSHIQACTAITVVSEPWKTLNERIDFKKYILLKQAYVCMAGEVLTGFIIFTPEPVFARGGYLRAIGVSRSMRRRGIGRKLLTFAEKETARCSQYLYLCVSAINRAAQAFYHDRGYVRAGKLVDLIAPGSSEYIYWKRLRPISQKPRRAHRD
jgi:ribosomal protein S18 acetylase RimI-like enzyme